MSERIISLEDINLLEFFGINNSNLNLLKKAFPKLRIVSRGNKIKVNGAEEEIENFHEKVNQLLELMSRGVSISEKNMEDILLNLPSENTFDHFSESEVLVYGRNGLQVRARTYNQRQMVRLSESNDILFAIGPAGTGKTYTAVAIAVRALKNKVVKKIILTRPAVEAGESLGFLPGDLKEKIDPYLRPLYDALDDMIPIDKLNYFMQNRVIEVAPLAFMRGRTLDHSYIILDEAQNATNAQLKMFLTRIGPAAKCIVTGDLTQIDLPKNQKSGLTTAVKILEGIEGIATVYLNEGDVIRHRLVKKIIHAYDRWSADTENPENANTGNYNKDNISL
ncbi:MAG: phosphate starvation protein PhoH [Chitinophagales bacterium]|nr:MAG: phosphate starvation protein PhoH [Chitinophagales bacterium]